MEAGGVDAAGLFDAVIVAGEAEAGAQTEAAEIEPADFEGGALLASIGVGEEGVGELAGGADRPGVAAQAEQLFKPGGQFFGRGAGFRRWGRRARRSKPRLA